jgi:glyoxylate/hydroxypyruvate reductase A
MKKIAVLLRSNTDEWLALLRAALPQHIVVAQGDETADAAYALVGKPAPGVLAALRELQIVFSVNAGIEALLESGEVPAGIPIVRMVDDGLAEGMLEWVLAATLAWHRNLFEYRDRQLQGTWAPSQEILARHRRVTVLGAGHLGGRVAAALAQIGFNTRVWSRTPKQIPGAVSLAGQAALPSAIKDAEILINLLPLTPATENLLDAPLLTGLAPKAVLINAGRGRHVVDRAVLDLLDSGRLRAAVLDVFREEPLPSTHPFWRHPGVYITPHVAAPTHASTAVAAIAENLLAYESGATLRHVVDPTQGY